MIASSAHFILFSYESFSVSMRVSLQGFLGQKLKTNSEEVNQKRPRLAIENMVGFSETQDNLRASVQLPVNHWRSIMLFVWQEELASHRSLRAKLMNYHFRGTFTTSLCVPWIEVPFEWILQRTQAYRTNSYLTSAIYRICCSCK